MSIQFKTIKQLGKMLNNKEISHVELIQETFSLIKKNNHLNAFVTLNEQESLKKAETLDKSPSSSTLAGIPIAQKDLFLYKRFANYMWLKYVIKLYSTLFSNCY